MEALVRREASATRAGISQRQARPTSCVRQWTRSMRLSRSYSQVHGCPDGTDTACSAYPTTSPRSSVSLCVTSTWPKNHPCSACKTSLTSCWSRTGNRLLRLKNCTATTPTSTLFRHAPSGDFDLCTKLNVFWIQEYPVKSDMRQVGCLHQSNRFWPLDLFSKSFRPVQSDFLSVRQIPTAQTVRSNEVLLYFDPVKTILDRREVV